MDLPNIAGIEPEYRTSSGKQATMRGTPAYERVAPQPTNNLIKKDKGQRTQIVEAIGSNACNKIPKILSTSLI